MSKIDLCRVCLASEIKMYDIVNTRYQEIFERLSTELRTADGRPETVCFICLSQLQRCLRLVHMSQAAEQILTEFSLQIQEILRQLIAQSAHILENKSTITSVNFQKIQEWKNIAIKFNEICGKSRTDKEMKLVWKRMKLSAKANVSNHRREQSQTGGGGKPPSPAPEDLAIIAIAPHDFIVEVNDFDSDAVIPTPTSPTLQDSITTAPEQLPAGPSIGSIAGPSIEFTDLTLEEHTLEDSIMIEEQVVSSKKPDHKSRPAKKMKSLNRTEEMRLSITSSNVDFKKQQIKIMEMEHSYNINYKQRQKEIMEIEHLNNNKIAQLKIKKLELEIALLEHKKNTI